MCRNIKNLFNFDPPATDEEIRDASLQFVRKVSGFTQPSQINEQAFNRAVTEIAKITKKLLDEMVTDAPHKNREKEAQKQREKNELRFGVHDHGLED